MTSLSSAAASDSPTILKVDDNQAACRARTQVLRQGPFQVIEARNGGDALRLATAEKPQLIVLEVNLRDVGDVELCQRIKADPRTRTIPILQISSSPVKDIGADAYLVEPVEPEVLLATVRALFRMRRAEEALRAAAHQWEATFHAINDGVAVLDPEGRVLRCNSAFERIMGEPASDIAGRRYYELEPTRPESIEDSPFQRMLRSHCRETAELHKGERWYRITADPVFDESGKLTGAVCIVSDITDRKRAEEALRRSNNDLQQFAFVASHELQEPLRTIASYTQLLVNRYGGKLDTEAKEFIHYILGAVQRMQALIKGLLAYSRVVGQREKAYAQVNLELVLQMALADLQAAIQSTGATITHDALPVLPGDENQLVQLFQNLISNCVKYRSNDPPRIHIAVQEADSEWMFSVSDNGIGIEPRYLDQIFFIFRRLHGIEYPGAGIGLAICNRIVEAHGGRIWAESTPGKGSVFHFVLPA